MALTEKQIRFCEEYLIDANATRAYKVVYAVESDEVAAVNASKLLRNAKVKNFIDTKRAELAKKYEITQDKVLEAYRRLVWYDNRSFYNEDGSFKKIPELDEETAFALEGFEVTEEKEYVNGMPIITGYTKKIKTTSRRAALDSICRVLGYNAPEKKELTGKDGKDLIPAGAIEKLSPEERLTLLRLQEKLTGE